MQNPRLAGRYAKSLVDLSIEQGQLETVFADMQYLQAVIQQSAEFKQLMKSPVVSGDKKLSILQTVVGPKVSTLTMKFIELLVKKGREKDLAEIAPAFIQQYKKYKNIFEIKLTTAVAVDEQVKQSILQKVQLETHRKQVDLQLEVNPEIIGGFVLEMGDTLLDASIARDLRDVKKQFLNNDYIFNIR
jgi:F-type H+-transporting ATPase subunit delta